MQVHPTTIPATRACSFPPRLPSLEGRTLSPPGELEPAPDWVFPSAEKTALRETALLLVSLTQLLG